MTSRLPYVGNGQGQFLVVPSLLPYQVGERVLLDDLQYTGLAGKQYVCPKHFFTNLASIPWLAEPIFNSVDFHLPGVMHDWLYCSQALPRAECDELLTRHNAHAGEHDGNNPDHAQQARKPVAERQGKQR